MKVAFIRNAAVAGLLLSAVAAQAASTFDIKFNFRTPVGEHAAGKYVAEVRDLTSGASKIIYLRSLETGKAVMIAPMAPMEKLKAEGTAQLKFRCSNVGCNLAEVWKDANYGFAVRERKATPAESERVAVVVPATTPTE